MSQNEQIVTAMEEELLKVNQTWMDTVLLCKGVNPEIIQRELCATDITCFGTGRDEHGNSYDEWQPMILRSWEQLPEGADYSIEQLKCRVIGTVGIVEVVMNFCFTYSGDYIRLLTRLSMVYEYRNDEWQAIHVHASFPSSDQPEGEAWPIEALKARNQELEKLVAERTAELKSSLEQLKATQAQLIHSEKMASLGELTAGIAHEIQNPLNFINNFSDVNTELIEEMEQEVENGNMDEAKEVAKTIKENNEKITFHGKRADSIVKNMLQHSRKNTGQKEPVDLNALAEEYLRLSYHGLRAKDKSFNATMKTNFDQSVGKVNIVGQDVSRVLLNLFNNAFYSVNEKKKSYNGTYEPTVELSTKKVANTVQVAVKDNGLGISQKVMDKIYQPFFTTKPTGEGTGLGLSMSYEIIKNGHGGDLKVDSKEGEYAEFKIILPADNHMSRADGT
ncbi:MAG TPA: ATP-binding protein [Flavisolibacter sp.]|nr:ATP-binding protein [Flavisolibacter sp.]